MELYTRRLILRRWKESDAENLFEYAKDCDVGPVAGWPPHKNVLCGAACFAICLKSDNLAIGCIELKLNGTTDMTCRDDECELGFWLGKKFWGQELMSEAGAEIIRYGFEDFKMNKIWCGYYDGNLKSKRVQEKLGFTYHSTCTSVPVPLMNETRIGHKNCLTKEQWKY